MSTSKGAPLFGQLHQMYREEEELPAAAKAFYDRAGKGSLEQPEQPHGLHADKTS